MNKSIWTDSMRVGLHKVDDARKNISSLVEELDLSPLHTVSSDVFLAKFETFETAIKEFFKLEEALFYQFQVPDPIMKLHIEDHRRILEMMNAVDVDSMNQRNKTAVDVYQMFRNKLLQHVVEHGSDLREYVPNELQGQ